MKSIFFFSPKKPHVNIIKNDAIFSFDFKEIEQKFIAILKQIQQLIKINFPQKKATKIEVSLNFVNANEIQKLNERHRNLNKTTDVLSFPSGNLENSFKEKIIDLGDIFINWEIIDLQATSIESNASIETLFLFMHGCLHLIGYDHIDAKDAELMYEQQRKIFAKTKIREGSL